MQFVNQPSNRKKQKLDPTLNKTWTSWDWNDKFVLIAALHWRHMSVMASQITGNTFVCSTVGLG